MEPTPYAFGPACIVYCLAGCLICAGDSVAPILDATTGGSAMTVGTTR